MISLCFVNIGWMASGLMVVGANSTDGAIRYSDDLRIVIVLMSEEIRPKIVCDKEEQS